MKYEIDKKWLYDHALELKELYFILKIDSQKYILQEKNWQDQMRKHMVMNEPSVNPPSFQIDTSQFTLDKVINDYDEQFIRVIQSLFLIGKEKKDQMKMVMRSSTLTLLIQKKKKSSNLY